MKHLIYATLILTCPVLSSAVTLSTPPQLSTRIQRHIVEPDSCDYIVRDGGRITACTLVTHIR
jgi:hypothetical protein